METPPTHRAQLDALFSALPNASDFTAAQAAITSLRAEADGARSLRASLWSAIGGTGDVPEHYDFAASLSALRDGQQAIFGALGVTDQASAVEAVTQLTSQVNNLRASQTTLFAALGATDLAGAMRAVRDIDGRIEAGVNTGLIARAASAGLGAPLAKDDASKQEGGAAGGSKTATRAEFDAMNAKQRLEFSAAGGKIVTE